MRLLASDIDQTLTGDPVGLRQLQILIREHGLRLVLLTSRRIEGAFALMREWDLPEPDAIIGGVGSEIAIRDGRISYTLLEDYTNYLNQQWDLPAIAELIKQDFSMLEQQDESEQSAFKLSYDRVPFEIAEAVQAALLMRELPATVIYSHDRFLDILPQRASKAQAVAYLAAHWEMPLGDIVSAGDSGKDAALLCSTAHAIVVGNYHRELQPILNQPHIYVAKACSASGVAEGLRYWLEVERAEQILDYMPALPAQQSGAPR